MRPDLQRLSAPIRAGGNVCCPWTHCLYQAGVVVCTVTTPRLGMKLPTHVVESAVYLPSPTFNFVYLMSTISPPSLLDPVLTTHLPWLHLHGPPSAQRSLLFFGHSTYPRCPRSTVKPQTTRIGILAHGKMSIAAANATGDLQHVGPFNPRSILSTHRIRTLETTYKPTPSAGPKDSTVKRAFFGEAIYMPPGKRGGGARPSLSTAHPFYLKNIPSVYVPHCPSQG
jgi:hypothetical protein